MQRGFAAAEQVQITDPGVVAQGGIGAQVAGKKEHGLRVEVRQQGGQRIDAHIGRFASKRGRLFNYRTDRTPTFTPVVQAERKPTRREHDLHRNTRRRHRGFCHRSDP